MNESFLLKIALIFSVLGIAVLYVIAAKIEISDTTIEKINNEEIHGIVVLEGKIASISRNEKSTFISMVKDTNIDVIVFEGVDLEEGMNIRVTGKTEEYNNKKEIIAEKIEII